MIFTQSLYLVDKESKNSLLALAVEYPNFSQILYDITIIKSGKLLLILSHKLVDVVFDNSVETGIDENDGENRTLSAGSIQKTK